jgi:Na+/proline symporter
VDGDAAVSNAQLLMDHLAAAAAPAAATAATTAAAAAAAANGLAACVCSAMLNDVYARARRKQSQCHTSCCDCLADLEAAANTTGTGTR